MQQHKSFCTTWMPVLAAMTLLPGAGMVRAESTGTADKILSGLHLSDEQRAKLEAGDVLTFSGEPYEYTSRELAADATVVVRRSIDEVLARIESVPSIIPIKLLKDFGEIRSVTDFADVGFTDDEYDEAIRFLKAKRGKDYNLSDDELQKLRDLHREVNKAPRQAQIEAASQAMREILTARYESYRRGGLEGIPPYQRSSRKSVSIGRELQMTTESLEPVEENFNDYYRALAGYPAASDCCVHIFRWLKSRIRKRPTFALSHTIVQKTDDYLLVTERHYYVSHTLNSVQVTLAWLEWQEDTFLGLAMSASTDILESLLGRALRPLGRNKAGDLVKDVLVEIRDYLEQAPPPDG